MPEGAKCPLGHGAAAANGAAAAAAAPPPPPAGLPPPPAAKSTLPLNLATAVGHPERSNPRRCRHLSLRSALESLVRSPTWQHAR
eukprot:6827022-Prymnesium_polylepis.1